jgi:molybdopterin/thiamine biosynthesis adenylyltransferase
MLQTEIVTRGRVVVIGLGGIGLHVVRPLATFLASLGDAAGHTIELVLCDGDVFAPENTYRMDVPDFGNKAEVVAQELLARLAASPLAVRWVDEYVTAANVAPCVRERDCVLLACDNHATRKLVGAHCGTLTDVVLISGGNDGIEDGQRGTYGNIQVFVRKDAHDLTAPLPQFHPEIAQPADQVPDAMNCLEAIAAGAPQLVFVNLAVASAMCNALLRLMMPPAGERMYDEVALDIRDAVSAPHWLSGPQTLSRPSEGGQNQ